MNFHAFCAFTDEFVDTLPRRLLEGLPGGIAIERDARRAEHDAPGVYTLGEYIVDEFLGSHIVLYYGSFEHVLGDAGERTWREEIAATVRHELRHHLEAMAGVDDLGAEDLLERALRLQARGHRRQLARRRPAQGRP